ncbi:hypothetical protein ABEB36_000492 [Hypothenemus hampei]|uniref:Uncharacterized protein n=1 Tax=Hypothenemus hampei TaxID=57062 RepID=A0ABD1FBE7_HYPHA
MAEEEYQQGKSLRLPTITNHIKVEHAKRFANAGNYSLNQPKKPKKTINQKSPDANNSPVEPTNASKNSSASSVCQQNIIPSLVNNPDPPPTGAGVAAKLSQPQTDGEANDKASSPVPKKTANNRPPPLILRACPTKHKELMNNIKSITTHKFTLKYAKNSVIIIYCDDAKDFDVLKHNFQLAKQEFHTYSTQQDRSHAFVLRGLK